MTNNELNEFLKNCHKDLSVEDFEGKKVPCIGFEGRKFDDILNKVAGKPLSVDTNLNILQDGLGPCLCRDVIDIFIRWNK